MHTQRMPLALWQLTASRGRALPQSSRFLGSKVSPVFFIIDAVSKHPHTAVLIFKLQPLPASGIHDAGVQVRPLIPA